MPSQNFPRPLNQQLDKLSDPIPTNDVLADALLVTETTYFKGSGSSYTGTVPSNNFKYGVFCVVKRNDASFIVHATSADGTSSNYYDGSAWGGWTPSTNALNEQIEDLIIVRTYTESFTINAGGGLGIKPSDFNVSIPSGYSVLGFLGWQTTSPNISEYRCSMYNGLTSNMLYLDNSGSSQFSGDVTITLAFVRSNALGN